MARLDRLYLQDDDGLWDENGHEQRTKLFEWVFGINYNLPSHSFSTSTLRRIRDTGNVLCDRINVEDYGEFQEDIQVVSGIAEDIRDALLDYQVCSDRSNAIGVQLNQGTLTDGTTTGDIRPELQVDCESRVNYPLRVYLTPAMAFRIPVRCFCASPRTLLTHLCVTQRTYWC